MKYITTRGGAAPLSFEEAVMLGLAPDGGLLLPEQIPCVTPRLAEWAGLPFEHLARVVLRLFTDLAEADLARLVSQSYAGFAHPDVTPLVSVDGLHVLELFHGPTLAFKDIALQLLGNLFEYFLGRSGRVLNIIAATSGDTGSAAIAGVRGRRGIRIFVLYPRGRVSPLQERQMTTVLDDNVFNVAVEGTFDDCQRIVKALLNDADLRQRYGLGAVNSINWARILAQMVYYCFAALRVCRLTGCRAVQFAVPTGNFGDIFAGYLAARLGLPIARLVLATNENDILCRFFNTGQYVRGPVRQTISPSMDIQVASNFERYLYYRLGESPAAVRRAMETFSASGQLTVAPLADGHVDPLIVAGRATTADTLNTMREWYVRWGYLLDPHSAVGVCVAQQHAAPDTPMICLATAHPAKFPEAVREATGKDLARHPRLDGLRDLPTRASVLPADEQAFRRFLEEHA